MDILANGSDFGDLDVLFCDSDSETQSGGLERIQLTDGIEELSFEFWNEWSGHLGPLEFTLTRRAN